VTEPSGYIGNTIAPGDAHPGVPQLIRELQVVGDLPADATLPTDGTIYEGLHVDAVKSFQRLGLNVQAILSDSNGMSAKRFIR
jgi:hypothetical protein